jgi:superfamily II DNA helicase RecQ
MTVQYASFCLPVAQSEIEQENLNRFLRGHRAIQTWKKLVETTQGPTWSILVEYAEGEKGEGVSRAAGQSKVDYKEVLSPDDFRVFSSLRELRKKTAEGEDVPVYTLFANEQLAAMARSRSTTLAELRKIEGIGEGRAEKYGAAFVARVAELALEAGRPPF